MQTPPPSFGAGPLGQRAYEIADHLASAIGPRPAASSGEEAAQDYVESLLVAAGAETQRHPVDGIPSSGPARWIDIALVLGSLITARLLVHAPWLAVLYLPVFFLLPSRLRRFLRRRSRSPRLRSHNLVADHAPAGEPRGLLILGAHIDTAAGRTVPWPALRHLQRWCTELHRGFVLVLAVMGAVKLLTDWLSPLSPRLWTVMWWSGVSVALVIALFEAVYLGLSQGRAPSPGANDNGSSVGVALAAAEHLASPEWRPQHLALRYGFWTAEEIGLEGSRNYAKTTPLDPSCTWALNMDMVGTGRRLSFVRGVGILPFRRTDGQLNRLLRRVHPTIQAVNYFMRSSDFRSFIVAGIAAASLTGKGGRRNWYYHTPEDTSAHLQPELLQQAAQAVLALVRSLDEQLSESACQGRDG